jgi:ParB-like chromosome segregation protein Spo0J
VEHTSADSLQFTRSEAVIDENMGNGVSAEREVTNGTPAGPDSGHAVSRHKIVAIPVLSLRPGDSPRLEGEDKAHVARLAQAETALPPILVDRRTMRVIDGMHRLLAASLRGQETVDVEFFDGSADDAFLRAVEVNVTHGLPLSLADRRAAAARIIASHPQMSDRAIGRAAGLAARTVAEIRRRSTGGAPQLNARVGRDGRVRPLSGAEGRRRAAALLAERPDASLREVARRAGISPATVQDVRRRLVHGEGPVPPRRASARAGAPAEPGRGSRPEPQRAMESAPAAVAKLLRDPSLRQNEQGRRLLRVLQVNAVEAREWSGVIAAVPPYCASIVVQVARQYAQMWLGLAQELDERARIIEPLDSVRMNGRN